MYTLCSCSGQCIAIAGLLGEDDTYLAIHPAAECACRSGIRRLPNNSKLRHLRITEQQQQQQRLCLAVIMDLAEGSGPFVVCARLH